MVGLEVFKLEVSHDPGLPPGAHPPSWVSVAAVDGPGPIRVAHRDALVVTVGFVPPAGTTQNSFDASAVIVGDVSIPINAQVASIVKITVSPAQATIGSPGSLNQEDKFVQFNAAADVSDGSTRSLDTASVDWSSSNTNAAGIVNGKATGMAPGSSVITAVYNPTDSSGSFRATANLAVE